MTGPAVVGRTWVYAWTPPRRMGWPGISFGYPGRTRLLQIRELRVTIRMHGNGEFSIERANVRGRWAATRKDVPWMGLALGPLEHSALSAAAPDWVRELAQEALKLAKEEMA